MNVLLVEDDEHNGPVLAGRMRRQGWDVEIVGNIAAALAALLLRPRDVVVLDVKLQRDRELPPEDGLDILRWMRHHGHATPVIVMTAYPAFEMALECGKLDVFRYLQKPVTPGLIAEAVGAAAAAAAAAKTVLEAIS